MSASVSGKAFVLAIFRCGFIDTRLFMRSRQSDLLLRDSRARPLPVAVVVGQFVAAKDNGSGSVLGLIVLSISLSVVVESGEEQS